jgi:ABC-type transport system involved in multi-copper enzyme maturation permease subunit
MLAVNAGSSDQLSSVAGFAVMLVWAAAALISGYLLFQRRDA